MNETTASPAFAGTMTPERAERIEGLAREYAERLAEQEERGWVVRPREASRPAVEAYRLMISEWGLSIRDAVEVWHNAIPESGATALERAGYRLEGRRVR